MTTPSPSFLNILLHADPVVKLVIILLLCASIASWTIIIQRMLFLKQMRRELKSFEDLFWSGKDLMHIYNSLSQKRDELFGLSNIFYAGFSEFLRRHQLSNTQRAMRVAQAREADNIEHHLAFLATIGSTSPYVGLFGTVWGIMSSFRSLGTASQATLALVAPGISEALIATAIGLFAAIPAVIAYNRFSNETERLIQSYSTFQEEFSNILQRKPLENEVRV